MSGPVWKPLDPARWASRRDADLSPRRPNAAQRAVIAVARHSPLRRGVFRGAVTRLVFALGFGRPIDVRFRNATFRLEGGRNLIEYGLLLNPAYNGEDIDFLLGANPSGSVFVDIGSNIGLYALALAASAGPEGRVVAIDANPLMVDRLMRNAHLSGLGNVAAIATAVGDREGAGTLSVRKNDDAIVAVEATADGPIPIRALASIIEEAGLAFIDGLKIDIEGYEDKALVPFLDGAPRTLLPRRIVIEHPEPDCDYPGCTEAFARHGYRLEGRTRNNSLYRLTDG